MNQVEFQFVRDLVRQHSGLVLTDDKHYLVENRLMPLARQRQLKDVEELARTLRTGGDRELIRLVVEAMTTNESLFFRDGRPFEQLKTLILPRLFKARANTRTLRIWSAACSTGQEPYSIAMTIKELGLPLGDWRIEILGTDLSSEVLEKARSGIYSQFEVQRGMPIQMLVKYFKQSAERWQVDSALRAMVRYQAFNLLSDPATLGRFDIVFCRNVLIYFDNPTKAKVLTGIAANMADDGVLFLGGAETVFGITDRFAPVPGERGTYACARAGAASLRQAV
ncbi:MAG: CheR family methyltransferase [Alphaproteobacteria bacterium]